MKMTCAKAIIEALKLEGVDVVFGYPGGAVLPIYDVLRSSTIRHVLVRHEQSAAHAADGYARSTGKVGVCIATSGPGATNLVTGIATAYMDSIPIVAITGQVPTEMIGKDVFQEVDITGATEPFTKHNYLVKNGKDLPRILKEAFHIASTGRPGPVLVDIPIDVQNTLIDFEYPDRAILRGYRPTYRGHYNQIQRTVRAIEESRRPVICVGGGVISSEAVGEVLELARRIKSPVVTTLMGIGAYPSRDPLFLGMIGQHGAQSANQAIEEADLLIVLGARLADRAIGSPNEFAKTATIVHIDIDPAEIGKNLSTNIPLVGDIKTTLRELLDYDIHRDDLGKWLKRVNEFKDTSFSGASDQGLDPIAVIEALSSSSTDDTIFVTDVGQHQLWAGKYLEINTPRTFLSSGGLGTMGYGLPAAIGAKIANPQREVVLITGDGSFQMNIAELATISQESLGIKIIILNNSTLGMVRELQQHNYNEKYYGVKMTGNPDFVKLSDAYGIDSMRVERQEEIYPAIDEILRHDRAIIGEFVIDPDANVIPVKRRGDDETHIRRIG